MSTSLRDQLLKAGLINKKQANDAERQLQRQERQPSPKQGRPAVAEKPNLRQQTHQAAKVARDQALNRQQQEKAEKKARLAQIKQLIEQNRLPPIEGEEFYNFTDGNRIRRIPVNGAVRARLGRGEISLVRHEGRYDLVPAAIAARILERDGCAVIAAAAGNGSAPADEGYSEFAVPDDLIW